jgi:DNA-directed RNA polymerase specialized sigma subunit
VPYFKYADISESISAVIDEIEKERDPHDRSRLLQSFMSVASSRLTSSLQRLCFDLFKEGMTTSDIANEIGMSQRAVKRLISARATTIGVPNPLVAELVNDHIDIRSLVKN